MRSKRVREAVSKKRTWKSRLAAVQVEEAALQPELDKLEGDTANVKHWALVLYKRSIRRREHR